MLLGEKIKLEIEKSGIPIRQIALKIEMSEQNLYRIFKKDTIETKKVEQICDVLGLPISYFFSQYSGVNKQFNQTIGDFSSGSNFNAEKIISERNEHNAGKSTSNEKLYNELMSYKEKVEDLERLVKSKDETIASLNKLIEHLTKGK
jgi:transcriptional regulator with XRE-family HTH domain